MRKITLLCTLLFGIILLIAIGCDSKAENKPTKPKKEVVDEDLKISHVIPSSLDEDGDSFYVDNFNRYTKIVAPNGKSIHIVAQDLITDEQIVRCRRILKHYLTNFSGSTYGSDKTAVTNKIAGNGAILCLLNGEDGGNPIGEDVEGQPLYQNEIQVEGGDWYIKQNYAHRDASFEEILHFVHDNGIGVDGNEGGFMGALPLYQDEIRAAQVNALSKNIWGIGEPEWIAELTEENSLSQEYLAAVVDAYYGLWGAWTGSNTHSMWGLYTAKVRSEIPTEDPMGNEVIKGFFQPYLTYNARIDPNFSGTFSLKFDVTKPYTNHSRYLKDITLTGTKNSSVIVNELDNYITGNKGVNSVVFSGNKSEYTIVQQDKNITIVTDNTIDRDGTNRLKWIDNLQFADQTMEN